MVDAYQGKQEALQFPNQTLVVKHHFNFEACIPDCSTSAFSSTFTSDYTAAHIHVYRTYTHTRQLV